MHTRTHTLKRTQTHTHKTHTTPAGTHPLDSTAFRPSGRKSEDSEQHTHTHTQTHTHARTHTQTHSDTLKHTHTTHTDTPTGTHTPTSTAFRQSGRKAKRANSGKKFTEIDNYRLIALKSVPSTRLASLFRFAQQSGEALICTRQVAVLQFEFVLDADCVSLLV